MLESADTIMFSKTPPREPWGINFGGGLNSTAMIIECKRRGLKPNWILFADTGSEMPGTLEHIENMRNWCGGWQDVTTVRWVRTKNGPFGFEPLHENCLRTGHLPSKAYGLAGCTSKWKIYPMDKWRKDHCFQQGCFAVGYDADENRRIQSACKRGDDPNFTGDVFGQLESFIFRKGQTIQFHDKLSVACVQDFF